MMLLWKSTAVCAGIVCLVLAACSSRQRAESSGSQASAAGIKSGAEIYRDQCARCHGAKGEGVADKYDEPLSGDRSVEALARIISRTMPEDDPGTCTGDDAHKVAAYIHDAFYSPAARAKLQPARIQLARLTVRQYQTSVADLLGSFRGGAAQVDAERGLRARYFERRNFSDDRKVMERVDSQVEFQFGEGNPSEKIKTNEFSIRWNGSVIAEEGGDYEFSVTTENGVRLWVNDDEKPLIDGWVSSGREPREQKGMIRLLGGRAYPIRLDHFKFKDKTASIVLRWKPPHKAWETIPARNLSPKGVRETFVVTTAFPPDDSSVGYERGTAVSKEWDRAATQAAIEIANAVVDRLEAFSGVKAGATNRTERVQKFCEQFAERAFRRPLTPEQKDFFVAKHIADAGDVDGAVKRVVLLVLKSPRFLYPEIDASVSDDFAAASRLALSLWDSLPDQPLLQAAASGQLRAPEQVTAHAQRMIKDQRAKAKLKDFFHHWLELEEAEDITKDTKAFPDFNEHVLADLRTSLELFIEEVVWGERSDYRQLLLADHLYLNDRLAKFYGLTASSNDFQKVSFDSKQRTGVITHPYLLTAFAYNKNSSPIHRGVFLTRNIVGRALKPPPMAIEFMDGRFDPSLTMREKVSELTRPAACQTCHSVINPLGFSLEHYDAVGRYRTIDNKKPVDATSDYMTLDGKMVRITGPRDVAEHAAKSADAHRGFVQQLFHQTVKQPAAAYGANTLEDLRQSFAASEFNIQKLVVEIVKIAALHGLESRESKDVASLK